MRWSHGNQAVMEVHWKIIESNQASKPIKNKQIPSKENIFLLGSISIRLFQLFANSVNSL